MNKDLLSINCIRMLGIEAIEKAKSGHPGIVMGAAPMAYTLWNKFLNVNPKEPNWINRDRFVLSAGHGSALLYSLLHLSGFNLSIEDLKSFRKINSKTPGHPEVNYTEGVDATTGPLGQGVAMAVGMALAERYLGTKYNKENLDIINHYTYAICGDGDLMEGVAKEAISFAGLQKLNKLILLHDSNDICLDGNLDAATTDDVRKTFEAAGWNTIFVKYGNDIEEISKAIESARKENDKPTYIEVKTTIGYGSPNKGGTNKVHGAPIGKEELELVRKNYGWNYDSFTVPSEVYENFKEGIVKSGENQFNIWNEKLEEYKIKYSKLYDELVKSISGKIEDNAFEDFIKYPVGHKQATRNSNHDTINAIAGKCPNFLGGSADLAHSNMTTINNEGLMTSYDPLERNIQFGIREFAMAAILNGMSLHKGMKVYGATFFVFSDYAKAAIRMSALMKQPVTYVLTHDSIAVGEDGPTHQPIEQLSALRALPNFNTIRPADAIETQGAWKIALKSKDRPTGLILSRQPLVVMENSNADLVEKGAYIISKEEKNIDAIIIATGSEVNLAIDVQRELLKDGIDTRVISMPCQELFDIQDTEYRNMVLPSNIRNRISIEMGATYGWHKYIGLDGMAIGIDAFGESGAANTVLDEFGFTKETIKNKILKYLNK